VAFREVRVHEVREVLRHWLGSELGLRPIAERAGVDRKTARRYVDAAVDAGLVRDGGESQLTDELIGAVIAAVRPERSQGRRQAWDRLDAVGDGRVGGPLGGICVGVAARALAGPGCGGRWLTAGPVVGLGAGPALLGHAIRERTT
jgi:hypothetical protein